MANGPSGAGAVLLTAFRFQNASASSSQCLALGERLASAAARYAARTGRLPGVSAWHPALRAGGAVVGRQAADQQLQEEKLARLEAALFLAREPLFTRKLAKLAKLADGTEARTMLKTLRSKLDRRGSAMQVVDVAAGVQLLTRPQLAYRQPVLRAEIEAIRGVQCGEILRVLMERDLLRIVGRSEQLGRPFQYGTTKKFLRVFGLRSLEQLPPADQIRTVEVSS